MRARSGQLRSAGRALLGVLYDDLTRTPNYHVGPLWANKAGLSIVRMGLHNAALHTRPYRMRPGVSEYHEAMVRDGICVIPDFLPPDLFSSLAGSYEALLDSQRAVTIDDMEGRGVSWTQATIDSGAAATWPAFAYLVRHPLILDLAANVLRRRTQGCPTLTAQRLEVRIDRVDRGDDNSMLHADRHITCLKAFLYIGDINDDNGAYVYCAGSHRISLRRIVHEYHKTIEELELRERHELRRAEVTRAALRSMGVAERSYGGPPNTLIFANGMGFHRRGFLRPGAVRKQLRLAFNYLEVPRSAEPTKRAAAAAQRLKRRLSR